jgi:ketohexokinase
MDEDLLNIVADKLRDNKSTEKILVGFDGFIDEILEVVNERVSKSDYTRIDSIKQFSDRIAQAANLSANLELVPQQIKIGGNGPIMANALLSQGYEVSYFGALGKPDIDQIFEEFAQSCSSVISITNPGYTNALEFSDGKLMLGKMNHLDEVNWKELTSSISIPKLEEIIRSVKLIASNNWTMLSGMNGILKGLKDILSKLKTNPYFFIDLADPQKRTKADIREVLEIIHDLAISSQVILSMNKRESELIAEILDVEEDNIAKRSTAIRNKLDVDFIVVHPVEGAAIATEKIESWVNGPYTPNPKITTGAGDNFNAGFCNGLLSGLEPNEALVAGVFTSGFYVRNAKSPNRKELIDFIESQIG